jgi:hypothetical protein
VDVTDEYILKSKRPTDEEIEQGARALYSEWLKTTTYFRDFEELRTTFERDARIVLEAVNEE